MLLLLVSYNCGCADLLCCNESCWYVYLMVSFAVIVLFVWHLLYWCFYLRFVLWFAGGLNLCTYVCLGCFVFWFGLALFLWFTFVPVTLLFMQIGVSLDCLFSGFGLLFLFIYLFKIWLLWLVCWIRINVGFVCSLLLWVIVLFMFWFYVVVTSGFESFALMVVFCLFCFSCLVMLLLVVLLLDLLWVVVEFNVIGLFAC